MDKQEAADKLRHYVDQFGDWVSHAPPATLRLLAEGRRRLFKRRGERPEHLPLLSEAVQLDAVAQCRELLMAR